MKSLRLGGDFRKPALLLLLLSHPTHLITSRLIHQQLQMRNNYKFFHNTVYLDLTFYTMLEIPRYQSLIVGLRLIIMYNVNVTTCPPLPLKLRPMAVQNCIYYYYYYYYYYYQLPRFLYCSHHQSVTVPFATNDFMQSTNVTFKKAN